MSKKKAQRHPECWRGVDMGELIEVYEKGEDPKDPDTLPKYGGLVRVVNPQIGAVNVKGDYQTQRLGLDYPIARVTGGSDPRNWGKLL